MGKGPIRNRERTSQRAELGPEPGLVRTTDGTSVPLASPMTPAPPAPVQDLAEQWDQITRDAVHAVQEAVRVPLDDSMTEERYRAHRVRLLAALPVLGFRRGGLPVLGGVLKEATATERVIKLRWADGRMVHMPLHDPHAGRRAGDDDEEDDLE